MRAKLQTVQESYNARLQGGKGKFAHFFSQKPASCAIRFVPVNALATFGQIIFENKGCLIYKMRTS